MDYMLYGLVAVVALAILYFLYVQYTSKHVTFEDEVKDANVCSTTCDGDEVCMKCPN